MNQLKDPGRLQSLDALRGFDMIWIISLEGIVHGLSQATDWPFANWLTAQLHHSPWNGFTIYDLIFPLFIFVAGVAMPYSFGKKLEREGINKKVEKRKIYRSLLKRTVILILLGMIVNKAQLSPGYEDMRFASVLGRIGLACLIGAVIFLNCKLKTQLIWFFGLLLGYWALMVWIPVPGFGAGMLTPEGNLAAYIDRMILPGEVLRKVYDPEGLLSTLPAGCSALLGIFTGQFLRYASNSLSKIRKAFTLLLSGLILLGVALFWNKWFPINKNMWTSSFVLYAGGWSLLLLGVFYLVIDVGQLKFWSWPFVWIGTNSILIYLLTHGVIDFKYTSGFLFNGLIAFTPELWHEFWLNMGILLIELVGLRFLYHRKLFWKI